MTPVRIIELALRGLGNTFSEVRASLLACGVSYDTVDQSQICQTCPVAQFIRQFPGWEQASVGFVSFTQSEFGPSGSLPPAVAQFIQSRLEKEEGRMSSFTTTRAPKDRAFWVVTEADGTFQEGCESGDAAMKDCLDRNERAAALGIATRFKFIPNPGVQAR